MNITFLLDTAYVKCDGKWYECDNNSYTLLSESQIVVSLTQTYILPLYICLFLQTANAYILFYEIVTEHLCSGK